METLSILNFFPQNIVGDLGKTENELASSRTSNLLSLRRLLALSLTETLLTWRAWKKPRAKSHAQHLPPAGRWRKLFKERVALLEHDEKENDGIVPSDTKIDPLTPGTRREVYAPPVNSIDQTSKGDTMEKSDLGQTWIRRIKYKFDSTSGSAGLRQSSETMRIDEETMGVVDAAFPHNRPPWTRAGDWTTQMIAFPSIIALGKLKSHQVST
ncbi:hypothetical protein V8E51_011065 [Hyaloscypha variabilis]